MVLTQPVFYQSELAQLTDFNVKDYRFTTLKKFKYIVGIIFSVPVSNGSEPFLIGVKQRGRYILNPLPSSVLTGQEQNIFTDKIVPVDGLAAGEDVDIFVDTNGSQHDFGIDVIFLLANTRRPNPYKYDYDRVVLEQGTFTKRLNINSDAVKIDQVAFTQSNVQGNPTVISLKSSTEFYVENFLYSVLQTDVQREVSFEEKFMPLNMTNLDNIFLQYSKYNVLGSTLYIVYRWSARNFAPVKTTV